MHACQIQCASIYTKVLQSSWSRMLIVSIFDLNASTRIEMFWEGFLLSFFADVLKSLVRLIFSLLFFLINNIRSKSSSHRSSHGKSTCILFGTQEGSHWTSFSTSTQTIEASWNFQFEVLKYAIFSTWRALRKHWEQQNHVCRWRYGDKRRYSHRSNNQFASLQFAVGHIIWQATKLNFIRSNTLQIKFVRTMEPNFSS